MKKLSSNIEWQHWGRFDPLFGAASWPGRQKSEVTRWTDSEFYSLGESDWRDFVSHWQRYGLDRGSCAEIGCGPGRITAQLVRCFQTVYAIDVAQGSLDYARKRVPDSSVTFYLNDGLGLPIPDRSVTAVFSCHVFQHFDYPEVASAQFAEIHRVLKDHGTFMVHLPIHVWPADKELFRSLYRLRQALAYAFATFKRTLMALGWLSVPPMRGVSYELDWLMRELIGIGFEDIEVMAFATLSNGHLHSFVLGRKEGRTKACGPNPHF